MLHKLTTLIGFLFCFSAYNQEEGRAIYIQLSPDYCFRDLYPNTDNISAEVTELREQSESSLFGYTLNIGFKTEKSERLSLLYGLRLNNHRFQARVESIFPQEPDPLLPSFYVTAFNYNYFTINTGIQYHLINNKVQVYSILDIGLSTFLFLQEKSKFYNEAGEFQYKNSFSNFIHENVNRFTITGNFGFGISFPFNEKLNISIEPVYRRQLFLVKNNPIKEVLYAYGINTGVYWKF